MKKKGNKTNYKNGKYSRESLTDEKFYELMNKAIEWFRPNIVKKDKVEVDLHKDNLFLTKFLHENNISRQLLRDVFQTRPWLKEVYQEMSEYQEMKIATKGLNRELDSSMCKFVLSNKHSWSEKSENTNNVNIKNIDLKSLVGFKKNKK